MPRASCTRRPGSAFATLCPRNRNAGLAMRRRARRTTAAALLALAAAGAPLCSKDPFDESPGTRLAL